MSKELELKDKIRSVIDDLEELYGELQGIEIRLEHPIVGGQRQSFADIKEFNLLYLHREQIEIK